MYLLHETQILKIFNPKHAPIASHPHLFPFINPSSPPNSIPLQLSPFTFNKMFYHNSDSQHKTIFSAHLWNSPSHYHHPQYYFLKLSHPCIYWTTINSKILIFYITHHIIIVWPQEHFSVDVFFKSMKSKYNPLLLSNFFTGVGRVWVQFLGVRVSTLVLFLFYVNVYEMCLRSRLSSQPSTITAPWVLLHIRWSIPLVKWLPYSCGE